MIRMHAQICVFELCTQLNITDLLEQVSVNCLSSGLVVWPGLRSSLRVSLSALPTSSCPLSQPPAYTAPPIG